MAGEFKIDGTCDERFQPVADAFQQNFAAGKEVGASLAVIYEGKIMLDLWGGHVDAERTRPWQRDTLAVVFSTTKMVTALCVLHLADRGLIDLDAPVAKYWPEFTSHGKDGILVRHVLSHTAGLPGFTPRVTLADILDWEKIIHILEAEKLKWAPGTKLGYHTLTYGFLLGEVVRCVSGKTLGAYLRDEITAPLGIDFFIGLPEEKETQVADVVPEQQKFTPLQVLLIKLLFPQAMRIVANPYLDREAFNTRECHAAQIPAGNGIGNARSVAQLGSILASGGAYSGAYSGKQVLSRSMVERATQEQVRGRDVIAFRRPSAWGLGVMLFNQDLLLGPRSFYTSGLGGSICVMDLERNVTLAYVMNRMAELSEGDTRSIPLVQKLWKCMPAV
ncbi:MAG: beta-lactamase family protein [Anaerolineales bacterium]|jgi:CubicO group peptidase (beta-lactamase class C family)|nr:beta-lactamase family protein [Anaerolineales bacterium]